MKRIAALILAAGGASRYGSCKQLIELDGKILLQRSIDMANEVLPGSVFVVTGAYHQDIKAAVRQVEVIYNPDWKQGLGSSIAFGVRAIEDEYHAIMVLLADQIAVEATQLSTMVSSFNGSNIVCARYAGSRGVPALFGQHAFGRLKRLNGNRGAKALLNQSDEDIIDIEIPQAGIDIDTPADLERWKAIK